jgi:hypothetical protein
MRDEASQKIQFNPITYPRATTLIHAGIIIPINPVLMSVQFAIRDNREPHSNSTHENDRHSEKHPLHKISTDAAITMSTIPVSRIRLFQAVIISTPIQKKTDENNLPSERSFASKSSPDAGTVISTTPVSLNGHSSIGDNLVLDSNVIKESDPH